MTTCQFIQFPEGSHHAAIVIGKGGTAIKALMVQFRVKISIPKKEHVKPQDMGMFPFIHVSGRMKEVNAATLHIYELVYTSMFRERGNLLKVKRELDDVGQTLQHMDVQKFEYEEQIKELKMYEDSDDEEEDGITMNGSCSGELGYKSFVE